MHQPLELAHAAGSRLLELLGFSDVVRKGETVTSATPDTCPGYILTRFADKYGRPVSLAYAGATDHDDLAPVFTGTDLLHDRSTTSCLPRDSSTRPSAASSTVPDH